MRMTQQECIFLHKLLNSLIKKGKKATALKVVLSVLSSLKQERKIKDLSPIKIIYSGLQNVKPLLHIQKVRKSSKVFYLPKIITTEKKMKIALQWIIKSVNSRKEYNLENRLANEFLDCYNKKGLSIAKKKGLYETIALNRPFLNLLVYK